MAPTPFRPRHLIPRTPFASKSDRGTPMDEDVEEEHWLDRSQQNDSAMESRPLLPPRDDAAAGERVKKRRLPGRAVDRDAEPQWSEPVRSLGWA